MRANHVFILIR
ncbi:hypothetical protein Zm00014a_039482 [Zea mays]|uniref:Uncharacterized protein n=1 Tax=Zea mays TaxID=4577 RepID=A0A317YJF1_MAIZE|nr:hypothetical protein Zm00014a_039482 [Zea mays]